MFEIVLAAMLMGAITFSGDVQDAMTEADQWVNEEVNQEFLGHEEGQVYGWGNTKIDKFGNAR